MAEYAKEIPLIFSRLNRSFGFFFRAFSFYTCFGYGISGNGIYA
jgi:hypothetical protein